MEEKKEEFAEEKTDLKTEPEVSEGTDGAPINEGEHVEADLEDAGASVVEDGDREQPEAGRA